MYQTKRESSLRVESTRHDFPDSRNCQECPKAGAFAVAYCLVFWQVGKRGNDDLLLEEFRSDHVTPSGCYESEHSFAGL
jgi:hypothetical protein